MKIVVRPYRLQLLGYKFQAAASELRSIGGSIAPTAAWEADGAAAYEARASAARNQAAALASQSDDLARFLLTASDAFAEADQRSADNVEKTSPLIKDLIAHMLPWVVKGLGLDAALVMIANIVRLGGVLGESAFLDVTEDLRYLFAGKEKELHDALMAAKIAYYQARDRGDVKGMEAAHQQANFLRTLGAAVTDEEEQEINRKYGVKTEETGKEKGNWPADAHAALSFNVFTPSGLTVEQLEQILADKPALKALAKYYIEAEKQYGVNALFMVAKDAHETGWGSSDYFTNNNNTGGYFNNGVIRTFATKEESIMFGAEVLAGKYYKGEGRDTIPEIQAKYAPTTGDPVADNDEAHQNKHWQGGVAGIWADLGDKAEHVAADGAVDSGSPVVSTPPPESAPTYSSPVGDYVVSDNYGATEGRSHPHTGIDLVPTGDKSHTAVHPFTSGKVVSAGWSNENAKYGPNGGYGLYVIVEHPDGTQTLYGHLKEGSVNVHVGQTVGPNDAIGTVGHTGNSVFWDADRGESVSVKSGDSIYDRGNHLHFEVRVDGNPVDPHPYLEKAKQ